MQFKPDRKTAARLVGNIAGTVFTLGDNVYPKAPAHSSATATISPGASTKKHEARSRRPGLRNPRGEALLRLLRMAGGKPTRLLLI